MDEKQNPAIDSKFRRVLVAAQRAEQILRGARPKVEVGKKKAIRVAMEEIDRRLVDWGYGPAPQEEQPEPAEEASAEEEPVASGVH